MHEPVYRSMTLRDYINPMKKILIFSLIILVVLTIVSIFIADKTKKNSSVEQQQVGFPSSNSVTSTTTTQNNLMNSDMHADPNNPGYYYIGNQPSDESAPFLIRYIAETHNYTIAITQEPIGVNRKKAEQYLMQKLGATQEQMCSLDYAVYISNDANSQYSGENLGFSFCPGAVQLPN